MTPCPLCFDDDGQLVARTTRWRLIRVTDTPDFPAFYRVVWNAHVAELSDLSGAERAECLEAVVAVERVLREHLSPTKINLAALGNMVPHLHWHVIARFADDSHFPAPIWGERQRPSSPERLAALAARLPALDARLAAAVLGNPQQHR